MPPAKTGLSKSVSRLKMDEEGGGEEAAEVEGAAETAETGEAAEGGCIVSGEAMVTVQLFPFDV